MNFSLMEHILSMLARHIRTKPMFVANKIICVFPVVKDKPQTMLGRWKHVNEGCISGFTHDPGYETPVTAYCESQSRT